MFQDPEAHLFLFRQRVAAGERRGLQLAARCCVEALSPLSGLLERLARAVPRPAPAAAACCA